MLRISKLTISVVLVTLILGSQFNPLTKTEAAPVAQSCVSVGVTSPRNNAILRGTVEINGSANIADFNFYKVEFLPANNPTQWVAVSTTYNQPVTNGRLDSWTTTRVPDGPYSLRLVVVDKRAQEVCNTVITGLVIANTQPTATVTPTEVSQTPTPRPPTPTVGVQQPQVVEPTFTAIIGASSGITNPTAAGGGSSLQPTPTRVLIGDAAARQRNILQNPAALLDIRLDMEGLGRAFVLGAGATSAVFMLLGILAIVRRLLS
ncbi:MAG: hypothetical protein EXR62_01705 [Chloroflexi bacterium]|nr:hypothetical protein [Chloroflexota bacterium]